MAFPTSGLTNNLVHKEGNRAFVYDSALGVWDQVRESDRTENKILSGTIGSGVTFPAGHVLRTFYAESDAASESIAYGATLYWDELDLSIPASSTSDYLIITLTTAALLTQENGQFLNIGFAYSTNDWTTPNQLGSVQWYDRPGYSADSTVKVDNACNIIRVNHPTALAYRIRPKYLHSADSSSAGVINLNQSSNKSTILAIEVKG
jgi:hypothetical protein